MTPARQSHIGHYQGRRLRKLEWGLYADIDRPHHYLLRYRSDGHYVRQWYIVNEKFTIEDLQDHVRAVRAAANARRLRRPVRLSAELAVDRYVAELERRHRSRGHVSDVAACLARWAVHCPRPLLEVSPADVEGFLGSLEVSARTQNKYRAHVHALFAWATRRDMAATNPVEAVAPASVTRKLIRFPTPEEFAALVGAVELRHARIWTLLLGTGLRRGSLLSLDGESFQDDGILVRHTKEGAERFLSFATCPLWRRELSEIGRGLWSEKPVTPAELQRIGRHAKAAGWPYTLHSLRHAFCSWLALMGEPFADIRAWAGHSSVTTTEKWYAHLRPGGRRRMAEHRSRVVTLWTQCLERCLRAESVSAAQTRA